MILKYSLFSQIYGRKLSVDEIITYCSDLNRDSVLVILSKLSYSNHNSEFYLHYFKALLDQYDGELYVKNFESVFYNSVLLSGQGIMVTIKYVLLYSSDKGEIISAERDEDYYNVFRLVLAIQDHLTDNIEFNDDNTLPYFYRNILFNNNLNFKNEISRAYYLYLDERSNDLFKELREYVDLNTIFIQHYGYSLKENFVVLIAIFNLYLTSNPEDITSSWLIDIENYFNDVKIDSLDKIISDMIGKDLDREKWLLEKIESSWDEQYFFDHPLMLMREKFLLSYTQSSMIAQLYHSLFFKIQKCFENIHDYNNYSGRALEIYLDHLTYNQLNGKKMYRYIQEFKYKKKQRHSPDIMIKSKNKILVIEVKNRKISYEGYCNNNDELMRKSYESLMIDPVDQAIERIEEIVVGDYHEDFSTNDEYYFMGLTYNTLPLLAPDMEIRNKKMEESVLNIKGIFNASIQDFEILLEYAGRKSSKSIFNFLDRVSSITETTTIVSEMINDSMHPRQPDIVMENIDLFYGKMLEYFKREHKI